MQSKDLLKQSKDLVCGIKGSCWCNQRILLVQSKDLVDAIKGSCWCNQRILLVQSKDQRQKSCYPPLSSSGRCHLVKIKMLSLRTAKSPAQPRTPDARYSPPRSTSQGRQPPPSGARAKRWRCSAPEGRRGRSGRPLDFPPRQRCGRLTSTNS